MSSRSSEEEDNTGRRLGGARADFVASLGRKLNDTRDLLAALEDDPSSKQARDELRRRLHALGAGARLLRFDAMSGALQEALAVLDRGAQVGALREQEVALVAQVVDDLPALAWSEAPPREAVPATPEPSEESPGVMPIAVLVVGDEALADALGEEATLRQRAFESERTEDPQTALELARAYAPDVMLVDADVSHAIELVEALLDDPLTEPVPIIVVGSFRTTDEVARFVALGVTKTLLKPVAPELLRSTCDEILDAREGRTIRVTLGEPTLEQLADRLSEELKRALVDSVDRTARSCRVPLGEGTEVLGALWGAIARVQEIVTQKTGGAVRFGGDAPEGTIALAPWLHHDVAASERLGMRGRGAAADVRLNGRRVVVADDDPGVTWFISDLLRTAGCEVHEALDGTTALEIAYRIQPELVVSDILMPGMDGFALSRALRKDVALRDVPVILLSWKEDLLQRVRELGASAAAYMKKESDSRSILARVREVLRPRARVEMRLRGDGEVRGRLDGLTPRLLLELVGSVRKDARVGVRDASYLYEIEIRGGTPRKATRTASDGGYQSGERALASLLGVGAGRFVVSPSTDPIRGELTGTLFDQLARPVAAARGAVAASTGARTMNVERIVLDAPSLEEYLHATPDPARTIIKRIAKGASPRQMLLAGEVAPTLLEDVLVDLASRGAIRAVLGAGGEDLLTPAVEAALGVLRRAPPPRGSLPPNARPSVPMMGVAMRPRSVPPGGIVSPAPPVVPAPPPSPSPYESFALSEPPSAPSWDEPLEGAPSSLEDAVMREISDCSPSPTAVRSPTSTPPPIVEPSALRKRSSNPPANAAPAEPEERTPMASLPPDAMVPGTTSGEELAAPQVPASLLNEPPPERLDDTDLEAPYSSPFALPVQPVVPLLAPPAEAVVEAAPESPLRESPPAPRAIEPTAPLPLPPLAAAPRAVEARAVAPAVARRSPWAAIAILTMVVVVVVVLLKTRHADVPAPPQPTASLATPPAPLPTPAPMPAPASAQPSTSADPGDELPPGLDVPAEFGVIAVAAPVGARIRIDGAIAGAGPGASLVAAPGAHEVRVELEGLDAGVRQVIEVLSGKTTRVRSAPTP